MSLEKAEKWSWGLIVCCQLTEANGLFLAYLLRCNILTDNTKWALQRYQNTAAVFIVVWFLGEHFAMVRMQKAHSKHSKMANTLLARTLPQGVLFLWGEVCMASVGLPYCLCDCFMMRFPWKHLSFSGTTIRSPALGWILWAFIGITTLISLTEFP